MSAFLRRIVRWAIRRPRHAWLGDSMVLLAGGGRGPRGAETLGDGRVGRKRVRLCRVGVGDDASQPASTEERNEGLGRMLREEFGADEDAGQELMALIHQAAAADLKDPGADELRRALQTVRDTLRGGHPRLVNEPGVSVAAAVDALHAIDHHALVAIGWVHDPSDAVERITAISPEGQRVDLLDGAFRRPRPDVEGLHANTAGKEQGFTKYFELPLATRLGAEWVVELHDRSGRTFELNRPVASHNLRETRGFLLGSFRVSRLSHDAATSKNAQPALERIQAFLSAQVEIENVVQYGSPPPDPHVSIVVPLYQRIDLVEHQLAHFGRDPEIAREDLIYVLDSPHLAEELGRLAPALEDLHGVPFRIATLNRNGGYAVANNLGAGLARGPLLLLLNSDVMPDEPGWLGAMAAFYAATPNIGALGPKLLFEDDSIQHAGMYFQRDGETALWTNQHYFKGFARSLQSAAVTRPVPAVTGACLMLDRALYEQMGGLWPGYIEGGYEDSDLCVRLIEAGRRNWYLSEVELFHLEAQSYATEARGANSYNSWLQTYRLGDRIEEIMRAQAERSDAQVLAPESV